MADKNYKQRIRTIKIPIQIQQKADKITIPSMNMNFQDKLGWIKSQVGELPQKIIIKKQGGKMNTLQFLRNGSGIHIKKKNRGSFTRWCGGNVTAECIRRGKASSNPKIRKKATFADNARHFKHKSGGQIQKAQLGAILDYLSHPIQHFSSSIEGIWPTKKDYKNTIYINKNKQRLHYYDKKGNLVINSPVSTGAIAGAKQKSGDLKTPEGKFTISYSTDTADKHKFGDTLFYGLSYGRGIGIHGDAGNPNKLGRRASHGCIRMPNGKLRCLQKQIGTGVGVPVIIEKTGGKITDAYMKRSKVSSNPTLIKRTTFA